VFHLELRQFPHVARAFNLTREELDTRFSRPWVGGQVVELEDRRWAPERARLTIFEGPELRTDEIGMGRGWATVNKTSREVTEAVLADAQRGGQDRAAVDTFKAEVRGAARTPVSFPDVLALAVAEYPQWRVSERVALAEQAVWELLYQGALKLVGPDGPIESDAWQALFLTWSTWVQEGPQTPLLMRVD
jgi:hypothetical protein